jgi:hypothetical protein
MKRPRKIKRIKVDRTKSKPQGVNLNGLVHNTLDKLRESKNSKSVLTKKTSQKNVFLIKFITNKAFTPITLRKMRDEFKREGLDVLESTTQTALNKTGSGEKSFVIFKVRVRPKQQDVGKRSRKTMKKVLAFIGEP